MNTKNLYRKIKPAEYERLIQKEPILPNNYEDEYFYKFTLFTLNKSMTDYRYLDETGNYYSKAELKKFKRLHVESIDYDILIEKNGKRVKINAEPIKKYLIQPKVYRIDKDFNFTINKYFMDSFSYTMYGFSEMPSGQQIELLKEANDDELVKIETLSRKLKGQVKRIPNAKTKKGLETINNIRSDFESWYFKNKLPLNYKTIKTKSKTPSQLAILKELINRHIPKGVTIDNKTLLSIGKILVKNGNRKKYKNEASLISTFRKIAYRDLGYGNPFQSKAIGSKDNAAAIYHVGKTEKKEAEHPISKVILK